MQEKRNKNQEHQVIDFIKVNGSITNEQCRGLLNVEKSRATELLTNLVKNKFLYRHGSGRNTHYKLHP